MSRVEPSDGPELDPRLLTDFSDMLMRHPLAVQAAFSALVKEGRQFAQTEEGARYKAQLARSDLVGRFRVVWDTLTQQAFEEHPTQVVPTTFIDALVRLLVSGRVEEALSTSFADRQ